MSAEQTLREKLETWIVDQFGRRDRESGRQVLDLLWPVVEALLVNDLRGHKGRTLLAQAIEKLEKELG